MTTRRRDVLRNLVGCGLAGTLADWESVARLSRATAADARVTPDLVHLEPDIEPLVRLIEETPRDQCFEMITKQLREGLTYRRFLGALFLAGVRNVNPWPPGFDLHCVFVIQAAHQLGLDAKANERLLPLYWALDEFKNSQQKDSQKKSDFQMTEIDGRLPSADRAWSEFHTAMEAWDAPRAERAIVAVVRTASAGEIGEAMWRYGARDFRNIGHKAIYVANAWRTLQTIGWRHAEPVLRSLVVGILDFGADQRVNEYSFEDQAYLANAKRAEQGVKKLPADWAIAEANDAATLDLLATIRDGDTDAACEQALELLTGGKAKGQAVWDAVHLAAGEQFMRQPGILGLHCSTSANGLRYAYQATTKPETRLLMALQGVGWMCQFQKAMQARNEKRFDVRITELDAVELSSQPSEALAEVFAAVGQKPADAAKLAFAYGKRNLDADAYAATARSLVFTKGTEAHAYKFPAAVFEDYDTVSPQWRPHMLATSVYHLPGTKTPESKLMQRAREAIASLT